jgi:hypothetical protein
MICSMVGIAIPIMFKRDSHQLAKYAVDVASSAAPSVIQLPQPTAQRFGGQERFFSSFPRT